MRPSPTTTTLARGPMSTWMRISQAAAVGSTRTAASSLMASGTAWKFAAGNERWEAKAPARPTIPRTVRPGQWLAVSERHQSQSPQPTSISPTTRCPSQWRSPSGAVSTVPTNS